MSQPPIHVDVRIKQPMLQAGICATLQQDHGIAILDASAAAPQVDVLMVDGSAVPALAQQLAAAPPAYAQARILVVVASARNHAIECAFSRGIHGVVLDTATAEEMLNGVRTVARGGHYLCNVLARQAHLPSRDALTSREDDVLQLLAQGLCNKSIGRKLDIATETVKFHVKAIMVKLNATTRTEAASIAISHGLTEHFALSLPKRKAWDDHSRRLV